MSVPDLMLIWWVSVEIILLIGDNFDPMLVLEMSVAY